MHNKNLIITCLGLAGVLFQNSYLQANSCPIHADIRQASVKKYGTGNLALDVKGKKYLRSFKQKDIVLEKLSDAPCIYKMISEGTIVEAQGSASAQTARKACPSTADVKHIFAESVGKGKATINIEGKTYTRFFEESNVTIERTSDSPCTYRLVVDGLFFG